MSEVFEDFLNEMADLAGKSASKKSQLDFSVFSGTDIRLASHIPYGIPSRIPQLDLSLMRPGYPAGRIVEMYGFSGVGKTTAALSAMASAQERGGYCLWVDAEFAWSPEWASTNGVDPSRVLVAEADSVEAIFNVQEKALKARSKVDDMNIPFVMVVDSVTAVPSEESLDKEYGEVQKIGTDARAIRNGMRKLTKEIADNKALALYINHLTSKTSAMAFAKQSQSAGGHALKFYSSMRIQFSRISDIREGEGENRVRKGMKVAIEVEKNKVMAVEIPKVECQLLKNGFDLYENLFDALVKIGMIEKVNNRSYLFKETETQMSRSEWKAFVDNNTEGIIPMYKYFLEEAKKTGKINPYG